MRIPRRVVAASAALAIAAALLPWPCHAQTADAPSLISFQGRLTDTQSNPLGGNHNFVFAVYPAAVGGSALWTETQNAVTVTNGVLSVQLGAATPIPADVFRLDQAYLQITVDGAPLSPRQRLVSAPYALNSRLLKGRDYEALVSTDAAQAIGGQKTFLVQLSVSSDVYLSAGQLNVQGNRLTTPGGLLDASKLTNALPALDGSALTGISATRVSAGGVDLSTVTTALAGKLAVGGNAANITGNLSTGQIDLSTITAALAGKLSAGAAVSPGQVDLSTVTAALAGKLSVGAGLSAGQVDLSTVTTALAGKLSSTVGISPGLVDLSTVTTALAGKLSSTAGIAPGLVDLSTVTTALAGKLAVGGTAANITGNLSIGQIDLSTITAALAGKLSAGAAVSSDQVDLSTVTAALAGKLSVGAGLSAGQVDLSTVTTALAGKLSSTTGIAPGLVDLSTVTTALAGKLAVGGNAANITGNLSTGQIDLSTITAALAGKLSAGAAVSPGQVDLSTVTAALAGKLSSTAGISPGLVDLSTVTTALAGKLSSTAGIAPGLVDLSTVTTALAGRLSSSAGIAPGLIDLSTVTTALGGKLSSSEGIAPGLVDLSTVASALTGKLSIAGGGVTGPLTVSGATLTVTGGEMSVAASTFVVVGGRVGIGTSAPAQMLHVNGVMQVEGQGNSPPYNIELRNGVPGIGFQTSSSNGAAILEYRNSGGGQVGNITYDFSNNRWWVRNGGSIRLLVESGGNVAVGTLSPGAKFDVAGNAQFGSGVLKSTFSAVPSDAEFALSLSSGLDVARGPVRLNSGGFIRFPDGTTQASAASGGAESNTFASSKTFSDAVAVGGDLRVGGASASTMTSTGRFLAANGTVGAPAYAFGSEPNTGMFVQPGNPNIEFAAGGQRRFLINANGQINMPSGSAAVPGLSDITNQNAGLFMGNRFVAVTTDGVERLRANADGKVGVGTGAPAARLHVSSAGATATQTVLLVSSGTAAGEELLAVMGDGRTGIGSTAPAALLHVKGAGNNTYLALIESTENNSYLKFKNSSSGPGVLSAGGLVGLDAGVDLLLWNAENGKLRLATNGTERMTVLGGGNVGVGTGVPASKLHVLDGDIRVSTGVGQASRGIIFQDGSVQTTAATGGAGETNTFASSKTVYGTLLATNSVRSTGWTATPGGTGAGVELMYITPNSAGSLLAYDRDASRYKTLDYYGSDHRFYTNQSSNISAVLAGNGSLGLGTYPTDASARLHVSSASASATDTLLKVSSGTGAGQEIFVVKGGGNVGIGNTNPSERLHLERADAANSYMLLKNTHADGYGAGFRLQTLDRNWVLAATDNASGVDNSGAFVLQDESQGQVRMVVNSAGYMGVGTVTPGQKLEVEGGAIIAKGFGNRAGGTGSALEMGYDGTKSVLQSYDRTASVYKPTYLSASSFQFDQGNVGIGTANPQSKLEVVGDVQVGGATASTISASGYLTLANLGSAPGTAVPGRMYYDSGLNTLRFSTGATASTWVNISTNPGGVPAGTVAHFNLTACPTGWTELTGARGRYFVGLPSGGTLAGTSGTALTNLESRAVGQHNHGITDPGHIHGLNLLDGANGDGPYIADGVSGSAQRAATTLGGYGIQNAVTDVTINNAGSVAGTNAPYMQLLVCQCTGPEYCQSGGSAHSANAASNLAGGGPGGLPYQSAANVTAFLGIGGSNNVLVSNGSVPSWSATPTLTGTNFTGIPDGALTSNVALLTGSQSFSGAKTFSAATSFPGSGVWNATGELGVGTGTPASKLHVLDGDIRVSTGIGQASRGIIFQDGSVQTTAATGGAGETNTFASSKTVYGTLLATNSVRSTGWTATPGGTGAGVELMYITPNSAGSLLAYDRDASRYKTLDYYGSDHRFYTNQSSNISAVLAGNGSLGLGTYPTDASARLHVSSASASASDTLLKVSSGTGAGQELLLVKGDGNVGLGTSNPSERLHIERGDTANSYIMLKQTHPDGYGAGFRLRTLDRNWVLAATDNASGVDNSGAFVLQDESQGQVRMVVNSAGYMGVGTVTPTQKLEVEGGAIIAKSFGNRAGGTGSALEMGYDGTKSVLQSYDRTGGVYKPTYLSASSFQFDQGNVGIGTANPAAKLHVSSGALLVDGNASTALQVGVSSMVLTSGGNVGFQTAAPGTNLLGSGNGYDLTNTLVHVKSAAGGGGYATLALEGATGSTLDMMDSGASANNKFLRLRMDGGTAKFQTLKDDISGVQTDNILAMDLANGRTGFGTAAPTDRLQVVGNIGLDDDLVTTDRGCLRFNGTSDQLEWSNDCSAFQAFAASSGGGWTDDGTAVRLNTNTDNVGIGTALPQAQLHLSKPAGVVDPPNLILGHVDTTDHYSGIRFRDETSGNHKWGVGLFNDAYSVSALQNSFFIYQYKNKSEGAVENYRLTINDSGDVGLGTSSPVGGLHVMTRGLSLAGSCHPDFNGANVTTGIDYCPGSGDFRIYSHGNAGVVFKGKGFGVGTWTADAMLHVSSGNATSSDTLLKVSSGTGTGQDLLTLKGDGKLGLGTASPSVRLHVSRDAGAAHTELARFISPDSGARPYITLGNSTGAQDGPSSAGGYFAYDAPGAWLGLGIHGSNPSAIIQAGRVGINRTPVTEALEVQGAVRSVAGSANFGGGDPGLVVDYTGVVARLIQVNGASGSAVPLVLGNGNAEWARIDTTGRLGVGTQAPLSKLHVLDGDIRVSSGVGQSSRGIIFQDGSVQTTAAGSSQWATNATHIYNTNAGGVGIGIQSPTSMLEVRDNIRSGGAAGGFLTFDRTADAAGYSVFYRTGEVTRLYDNTAGDVLAYTEGARVGVGTVSPAARLHVSSANAVAADAVMTVSSGTSVGQELFVVKGDGKVGIGTASPTSTLTVVGAANISGTAAGPLTSHGGVTMASVLGGAGQHTTSGSGGVVIARQDSNSFGTGVTELVYAAGSNTNADALNNNDGQTNSVLMFGRAANLRDSGSNKGLVLVSGKADQHCITSGGGVSISGDCGTLYLNHGGGEGKAHLVGDVDSVYSQNSAPGGGYFSGVGRAGTLAGNSGSDNLNAAGSALLVGRATGGITTSAGEFLVVSSQTTGTVTPVGTNSLSVLGNGARSRIASGYGYGGGSRGANSVVLEFRDFRPLEQMATGNGLTVTDGDIRLSTTTGSRGVIFQDGTIQTSAASGAGETNTFASSKTVYGTLLATNSVRATGWTATPGGTGAGVELMYITPNSAGSLLSYDRDASRYKILDYYGSDHRFYTNQSSNIGAILAGDGSLGLGTYPSDASARLHVSSANAVAANTLFKVSSGTSVGQELLVVKGDGKVGIGTDSPGKALDVVGSIRFNSGHLISNHPNGALVLNYGPPGASASGVFYRANTVVGDESGYTDVMRINGVGHLGLGIGSNSSQYRLHVSSQNAAAADLVAVVSSGTEAGRELLAVKGDGKVGIRTANPAAPLEVKGEALFGTDQPDHIAVYGAGGTARVEVAGTNTNVNLSLATKGTGSVYFWSGGYGSTERMRIDGSNGHVGIGGAPNASRRLYVAGDIMAQSQLYDLTSSPQGGSGLCRNGTTGVHSECSSDRRLKKNIESLAAPTLASVLRLRPVEFDWINGAGPRQAGFIAQEVKALFPLTVGGDEAKGNLTFSPGNLVPYLTRAIQEQQAELDAVKARLEALERRFAGAEGR